MMIPMCTLSSYRSRLVAVCLLLLLMVGCDRIPELPTVSGTEGRTTKMIVVNEGLFTTNTAALSVIYDDGTTYFDVFRWVNGRPLGDVAQSMTVINGYYFVAVNNSRRIEILDRETFRSVGTIRYRESGSPRFITPLTDSTALVSDLHGQLVVIRTRPPYEEVEYMQLPLKSASIEKMTTVGDKVFGAYIGQGIAVLDCSDYSIRHMRIIDEVVPTELTKTCRLLVDHRDRLWVLTNQPLADGRKGTTLHCIDPATEQVVERVEIPYVMAGIRAGDVVGMPSYNRVDISEDRSRIYLNLYEAASDGSREGAVQTIYTVDVDSHEVQRYMQLPGVGLMYGMAISPDGEVCICDCLDYTAQRGYVRVYTPGSTEVKSYKVGVYPRMILFPSKS